MKNSFTIHDLPLEERPRERLVKFGEQVLSTQELLICLNITIQTGRKIYTTLTSKEILQKRKEIEQELLDLLEESGSDFGLDDIKEAIYNEDGQDSLTDVIAMFDNGLGLVHLENVLELVNDAWNYFPHKLLGGLSPAEKALNI